MDTSPPSSDRFVFRLLRRLPGGGLVRKRLEGIEQRLLSAIDKRSEEKVKALPSAQAASLTSQLETLTSSPGERLHALLARSQEQSREEAEGVYFTTVLQALVPDQARILAALSGGSTYPLIHVMAGTLLGGAWRPALECVSSVGKSAGVQCPELTHLYVQGLRQLGLVEIEAVESDQLLKYELLETETAVRRMIEQLKQNGQRGKIVRHTLKMSALGDRLWAACRPDEE